MPTRGLTRCPIAALSICCWLASVATVAAQVSSAQPPRVDKRTPLLIVPDASLQEALESTDAVVLVRVNKRLGTRVIDLRPELMQDDPRLVLREPMPVPFTEYNVTPVELLKPYAQRDLGAIARIASRGGVGQFDGVTIDEDTHAPELVAGRQYLLLTTFDVFDVTGPAVAANQFLRATRLGKELVGLPPERALRRVRMMLAGPRRIEGP
jgi:hypothetical protein